MSGVSITFTAEILAHARDRGIQLDHKDVAAINANINAVATLGSGGVTFDLGGHAVDLGEAVEGMSRGYGRPAETKPATVSIPAGSNMTERGIATNAANRANASAAKRQQAQDLVQKFGNPWRTNNRTHQAFVTNTAPDLVGRLKSEAGVRG